MVHYLEFIKAICKQSNMWELYNPRVIGMVHNIIKCIQQETELDREARATHPQRGDPGAT